MKLLLLALSFLAASAAYAQERSVITVKNSTVSGDAIIVTVQIEGETHDLQCSKSVLLCKAPEPGKYVMVRLPKNRGIYECANVDLYRESDDNEPATKVGQYCLLGK